MIGLMMVSFVRFIRQSGTSKERSVGASIVSCVHRIEKRKK